jgi:hypothetical protein
MAGMASIPGRPLARALRSLAPQVTRIGVVLNGYTSVPSVVRELGCKWVLDPTNARNAAGKFHWARAWRGAYITVDDDVEYPPDYVEQLWAELQRWERRVVVSAWGRIYPEWPDGFFNWLGEGRYVEANPEARWVNYAGTGSLMWDTKRVKVPSMWYPPDQEEGLFNVWAQNRRVPLRQIAHPYDWPARIPLEAEAPTLFKDAKAEGFATRNAILEDGAPWRVYSR